MYSISNDHINPSTTNNICSDQSLPFGGSLISISALQTVFQPSDHREQATRNALRGLVKLCETTPSRFYPPTQDHVQNQQHRKRLQQVFDALDSISIDSFDAAGTQLTLEDLRAFIKKTCRPATKHADKEAEKEIVLANAAATVADYQDKLDRQREFAAKVFVDGEQTAGVFAEWIRTSRERFGEELEFGERARQKPRPVMQSSGFGNTCVVYVV
ncbi:uncharacterized protein CTRU02_212105 [Colletotrichum truncatum]|uniref:Uncharacterized protein n=1 Tax=Colletotrichum truncatum TaxID=5467 RepID=A0ACC3YMU6_COLTU